MNLLRSNALKLRLAGQSYNEIQKVLKVPKSTLSGWFKYVILSEKARARIASRARLGSAVLVKRNKAQTHRAEQRARRAQMEGKARIKNLSKHELLIIGTALYWAEGYKRLKFRDGKERVGHTISFVNSDAEMVSIFVRFLRDVLEISSNNIRLGMRLYAHINEEEARRHWMKTTRLSKERFFKTTYLVSGASKGIRPHNRLPWGTLQVEVCDTSKFHQLMGMIEGVKERLVHDKVSPLPG